MTSSPQPHDGSDGNPDSPLVGPADDYAKRLGGASIPAPLVPHPHTWTLDFSSHGAHALQTTENSGTNLAPAVFVHGGPLAVNTEDIHHVVDALNSACEHLTQALSYAEQARDDVDCAVPPPVRDGLPGDHTWIPVTDAVGGGPLRGDHPDGLTSRVMLSEPGGVDNPMISGVMLAAMSDYSSGLDVCLWDSQALRTQFFQAQEQALHSLDSYIDGPQGLRRTHETITGLVSDLTTCIEMYEQADGAAHHAAALPNGPWALADSQRVGPLIPALLRLAGAGVGIFSAPLLSGVGALTFAGGDAIGQPLLSDGGQFLLTVMSDPILAQWMSGDALILLLTIPWAVRADSGRSSPVVEQYFADLAQRMDPQVTQALGDEVRVGTRMVAVSSLTPMQRLSYYVAGVASRSGQILYGEPQGIVMAARGTQNVTTLAPARRDPFGLRSRVDMTPDAFRPLPSPPHTIAQTIEHSDALQHSQPLMSEGGEQRTHEGSVSVIKTTHADGSRTWLVIVPGTRDWSMGDEDVQDLLTNLQAVAGQPTDMESTVVAAMRQAGIQPGEPVGFYGHSQGAITVANIAADPTVNQRFSVTTLLTAGGPTAGAHLYPHTHALHIENIDDAVPALDGMHTPTSDNRVVVTIDSHQSNGEGYPHMSSAYAQSTRGMEEWGEPAIDRWSEHFRYLTGAGEDGAVSEEMIVDFRREIQ